jgi:miniconductance mechanosensitive channel
MENSGGRRIKRAVIIKLNSVKYLSQNEVVKLSKINLLGDYLKNRSSDIDSFNSKNNINKELLINGRNLTNIGVFRKYVETYIENHSAINKDMMIMTRQLAPTTQGLPIEIYAFSSDKRWQNYEYIMADIFDHIIAAVPYFDLEIFELPTDLASFKDSNLH